jgi:hypothetical protein
MEWGLAVAVAVAVILGAPILAAEPFGFRFGFVENILTRLVFVGVIIYAVLKDKLLGLLVFLAVFTLILERNHALALSFPDSRPVIKNDVDTLGYVKGSNVSSPVKSVGIGDNIPDLDSAPKGREAEAFFKSQGLA